MNTLQTMWFLLVGVLLTGYAILDGFDLGVGVLHLAIAKNDRERRVLLNSVGPLWDGNEVWLLTGGGAIFAAFPKVYATVFSGFYLALMLVLVALIFRAVSLEFRSKEASPAWRRMWDVAFSVGSLLPALLFGVAIGNVLRGVSLANGEFAGTFLGLLNPFSLLVGLLSTAMFVLQGASWLLLKTDGALRERARRVAYAAWLAFMLLWALTTMYATVESPHLWSNFAHPLAWLAPAAFVIAAGSYLYALRNDRGGLAFALSSTSIAALMAITGVSLFPNLVPSFGDALTNSLTIANASSSQLTLTVMLAIALLGMPFVVGYTIFIYRKFAGPVLLDEHSY